MNKIYRDELEHMIVHKKPSADSYNNSVVSNNLITFYVIIETIGYLELIVGIVAFIKLI